MKKERVLIISTIKNALLGTNVNASETANVAYALRKEGFDVDVLTFNPDDTVNKQFYQIKNVNEEYDRIVTSNNGMGKRNLNMKNERLISLFFLHKSEICLRKLYTFSLILVIIYI